MLRIVTGRVLDPAIVTDVDGYEPAESWICPTHRACQSPGPDTEIVTDQYRVDGRVVRTVWRRLAAPQGLEASA